MTSQIDDTQPVYGNPTTASVRANFTTAKQEITALQAATTGGPFLPLAGGHLTGPVYLWNDPTDVMMPATKGYVDAHAGSGGGTGIPEAPADGKTYGRNTGAWVPALPLAGGTLTGALLLAADPTAPLGAATKQYVDVAGALATGAVQKAGSTMTGLLTLSGPPTADLHAATKLYVDNAVAPLAPIASPTFTGTLTAGGTGHIFAASAAPSLVLNDTTLGHPVFGLFNSGSVFGIGLASVSTGNANGTPFLQMDQTGIVTLTGPRVNMTGGRALVTHASDPALTFINLAGGPVFSFYTAVNLLYLGFADGNGVPQGGAYCARWDDSGNMVNTGSLTVGHGVYYTDFGAGVPYAWHYDGTGLYCYVSGAALYVAAPSDASLKTNIEPTAVDALAAIRGLPLHSFDMPLGPAPDNMAPVHHDCGFIAQDIAVLIPNSTRAFSEPDGDEVLYPQWQPLVAYLLRAVQQLADRLDAIGAAP